MKAILFDLDGVITSERIYWNCSGLAIAKFEGREIPNETDKKIKLSKEILPDNVVRGFKEAGINSNWDITYAMSILSRVKKGVTDFLEELKKRQYKGLDYLKLLDEIDPGEEHDREGGTWKAAHKKFQQCYYELEDSDEPVLALDEIKSALDELKNMGLLLGIVTGRPFDEAKKPLQDWGLWDYFEPGLIVTEDEVSKESTKQGKHLGKPNPYPILHAIFTHEKCDPGKVERISSEYIFVGDSVSDVLAAKNAGIPVICVETGIASKQSLIDAGADSVVEDITKIPSKVKKLI